MSNIVRRPLSAARGGSLTFRGVTGPVLALGLALAAAPAFADSDYPPGLFENSPVVGPGGVPVTPSPSAGSAAGQAAPAPMNPSAPPAYAAPPAYGAQAAAPPPPGAYPPSDDYCAGIASRTFGSLEEVRRAHAMCDHAAYAAPVPVYRAPY
jgi:hypothetical protein